MSTTVEHIIELIDQLPPDEREALEQILSERAEAEWSQEAEATRREAAARGTDQRAIDEAIERHRYGR